MNSTFRVAFAALLLTGCNSLYGWSVTDKILDSESLDAADADAVDADSAGQGDSDSVDSDSHTDATAAGYGQSCHQNSDCATGICNLPTDSGDASVGTCDFKYTIEFQPNTTSSPVSSLQLSIRVTNNTTTKLWIDTVIFRYYWTGSDAGAPPTCANGTFVDPWGSSSFVANKCNFASVSRTDANEYFEFWDADSTGFVDGGQTSGTITTTLTFSDDAQMLNPPLDYSFNAKVSTASSFTTNPYITMYSVTAGTQVSPTTLVLVSGIEPN